MLKAFRTWLLLALFRLIAAVGQKLPLPTARRCGAAVGRIAWHVMRRDRGRALQNIAMAFPEWPPAQHRATIRAMFRHLGISLFEIVWLPNLRGQHEKYTVIEGAEPLLARIREGRSVVAYTGHCGNWEWAAYVAGLMGIPLSGLQRGRDESEINTFITNLRASAGIHTIDRGSPTSGRDLIAALRRPGALSFLVDQNLRTESVKVPFFGRPAPTPIGPARLNVRTEAMAITVFIERREDGMHVLRFNEPIETHRGDDPVALIANVTAQIEAQIRRKPEQWVWMHDRWRERPQWDVSQKQS